MFENCATLSQLNAERIQLGNSVDLVTLNNAYNKRRQEIVASRKNTIVLTPVVVKPRAVQQYVGVPVIGKSTKPFTIELTSQGFLN